MSADASADAAAYIISYYLQVLYQAMDHSYNVPIFSIKGNLVLPYFSNNKCAYVSQTSYTKKGS